MMCKKPFRKENREFGCGQCTHCRINRSRLWVGRMLLESMEHPHSAFVTLTYNEEHLPNPPYLSKEAVQLFLKRLRGMAPDRRFRYYAVGEYGDKSWRPHYHLIIFGLSPTEQTLVQKCWPFGFVQVGTAEAQSMAYTASYVIKKMTNPKDSRLEGRPAEFSLLSRMPGLGTGVVKRMVKQYAGKSGQSAYDKLGWITSQFRAEGHVYPLGRYLTTKVLEEIFSSEDLKEAKDLHNQSVSLELCEKTQGKTASQLFDERRNKLSQQNSAVRIKYRRL